MRSKLQNITSRLLAILMVVGLCVTDSSCTDPETTDSDVYKRQPTEYIKKSKG